VPIVDQMRKLWSRIRTIGRERDDSSGSSDDAREHDDRPAEAAEQRLDLSTSPVPRQPAARHLLDERAEAARPIQRARRYQKRSRIAPGVRWR
jgi:hypothetical protein